MSQAHIDVVAAVKADLENRGVSLVGPCGAFAIVRRVAWLFRAEGAGLLAKPTGNNCDGFAVDIIAYPDGRIFDVLIDAGGKEDRSGNPIPGTGNGPAWSESPDSPVDAGRWRAPVDVDAAAPPAPDPVPAPAPVDDDLLEQLLHSNQRTIDVLEENTVQLTELNRRLAELQRSGLRVHV